MKYQLQYKDDEIKNLRAENQKLKQESLSTTREVHQENQDNMNLELLKQLLQYKEKEIENLLKENQKLISESKEIITSGEENNKK